MPPLSEDIIKRRREMLDHVLKHDASASKNLKGTDNLEVIEKRNAYVIEKRTIADKKELNCENEEVAEIFL